MYEPTPVCVGLREEPLYPPDRELLDPPLKLGFENEKGLLPEDEELPREKVARREERGLFEELVLGRGE